MQDQLIIVNKHKILLLLSEAYRMMIFNRGTTLLIILLYGGLDINDKYAQAPRAPLPPMLMIITVSHHTRLVS